MPRLGILGGTFDPPHNGHIAIAEAAFDKLDLEKLLLIPAKNPPHKTINEVSSESDRLEMLKLAFDDKPEMNISEIEIKRGGLSYTIVTLGELKKLYPRYELVFIIGADNISEIETWYQPEAIFDAVTVAAFNRPGFIPRGKYVSRVELFEMPPAEISSTEIRQDVRTGKAISGLVPPSVEEYIARKKLYSPL